MSDEEEDDSEFNVKGYAFVESSPNLARDNINMAVMFAEKAKTLEDTYTHRVAMVESEIDHEIERIGDVLANPVPTRREYRFYATVAVITAAAYVEACINELLYKGTSKGRQSPRLEMDNAAILANIYDDTDIDLFWYGTLRKYKLVLAIADKELETGGQLYENIRLVFDLRNRLIHHQPAFDKVSVDVSDQRFGQLERKFSTSPFHGGLFFPYQCMSFGCAQWAIESCLNFTEYFYSQIGVNRPCRIPEPSFPIELEYDSQGDSQ